MAYLSSNDVYVFPAANRTGSLTASLATEYNLVKLVTRLTSRESFVISDVVSGGSFEFCIKGYYFRIPAGVLTALLQDGQTLYAKVYLSDATADVANGLGPQISNSEGQAALDKDSEFQGLSLGTDPGSGWDLALITRTSSTYVIPPESLVRMCTDAGHRYVTIDDGDLDEA